MNAQGPRSPFVVRLQFLTEWPAVFAGGNRAGGQIDADANAGGIHDLNGARQVLRGGANVLVEVNDAVFRAPLVGLRKRRRILRAVRRNRKQPAKAGEQRDLLLRHAERVEAEIETLHIHLDYLRAKAALWDARDRADAGAEAEANLQVQKVLPRLEEVVLG